MGIIMFTFLDGKVENNDSTPYTHLPISLTLYILMPSYVNYLAQAFALSMVSAEGGLTMGLLGSKNCRWTLIKAMFSRDMGYMHCN